MSGFSIYMSDDTFISNDEVCALGTIVFGDFIEEFHAPLAYWNRNQYLSQWTNAVRRVLKGEKKSAIIQTMHNPKTANFIHWWPMYSSGETVHIQNHILLMADLKEPFDEKDPYKHISDRSTQSDEGEQVSEWVVPNSDLKDWVELFGIL